MNKSGQNQSGVGIAIYSALMREPSRRPEVQEKIHSTLVEECLLASKTIKPRRFFKLTADGQWNRKSADGKYNKLNAKRLLRKLQMKISKHFKRTTTE